MAISDYIVTIGLEVHCQIKTKSKMFCSCETGFGFEPNTRVCPTCLGLPGALPVLNEFAIERTLLTGLMLGCSSPEISQWEIGEVDRIWIRLYRELVEQRPDLEPLFNEPRDLSKFPQKGWMRPCSVLIDGMFRTVGPEDMLREEEEEQYFVDTDKWDAMYPEEAKERSARHWREMGLKE